MNKEILKAKIAEAISSTNTSGNEKLEAILAAVDTYSSASNNGKPLVSGALPPSPYISDVEILLKSSENGVYVNDQQRIGFQKGAKWIRMLLWRQ